MFGYRTIQPLPGVEGNTTGPPPELIWLRPTEVVVNEDYQRDLSRPSLRMIERMAANWNWCAFKSPSVAATDTPGVYEVVDGQHTVIAAATNGSIPFLPCMLMSADTLQEKANGFLGINQDRIILTATAIFNAKVAGQDPAAISVAAAMSRTGVNLLPFPPNRGVWAVGDTMAIKAMVNVVERRGEDHLAEVLQALMIARAAPIRAMTIRAIDLAMPADATRDQWNRLAEVLRGQGCNRLEMIARAKLESGARGYEIMADMLVQLAGLETWRKPKKARGRPFKAMAA